MGFTRDNRSLDSGIIVIKNPGAGPLGAPSATDEKEFFMLKKPSIPILPCREYYSAKYLGFWESSSISP
jgi:hypothetical protein